MKIEKGDRLVCVKTTTPDYPDDERLILGHTYKAIDIDIRMPGRVCVKLAGPYYTHKEFVPVECFSKTAHIRDEKLKQLGILDDVEIPQKSRI